MALFRGIENRDINDEVIARLQAFVPSAGGDDRRLIIAEDAMVDPSKATMIVVRLLFFGMRHLCYGDIFRFAIS